LRNFLLLTKIITKMNNAKTINTLENFSLVEVVEGYKEQNRGKSRRPIEVSQPTTSHPNRRVVDQYEPAPIFTTTCVFVFGSTIILLASIWTPLALLAVWIAARLQRYWFRVNDEPTMRRRLLKDFVRTDQLTAPLRYLPDTVQVEETYWVNRRYVLLRVRYCTTGSLHR
jgi:hypothetical protein